MFHLEQAAACGDLQALITMAEIHLQLPHDILATAAVQVRMSSPFASLYLSCGCVGLVVN